MADIQALATVSEIDGHAVIRDVNGVVRELNEGARLLPGETIATVKDSSVEVVSLAGEIVTVPENDALYINSEIFASTSYTRADGELADATVQEVLDIFANNPDLAGALEDPAAGGFLSNEAGHSFVRLSLALDTLPDFQRTTFDLPLDPNDLAPNEPDPNSDNQQFAAKVGGLNNPPQVEDINLQALEGQALITGAINAIDPDGDNLTYQVNGTLPPGFVLNTDGTFQFDASNPAYQSLADGEVNQITIPLTTTDNRGGSVTTNVVIQLTGTETAAVIARVNETVTETDTAVVVTGTVTATDADSPDNTFQPQTINGNTGTLTILENGAWTFVANSAFDELNVGEIVSETFPIASIDGTAGSITLNITGSNDSAIITNASTSLVETNSPLVTSGTLSALDADNPNNGFNAQSIDGTYGTLVIDGDGAWTFTANSAFDELNVEDNLTESFSVSSLDGTPGSITITINGTNDAAETTSDAATLTESDAPLTSSGVLQSSDIDNPENTFIAQTIVGAQGTLSLEAGGAWTFQANSAFDSLNVGDTLSETFTVASIDGTQSTIEIIINGSNDAAVVSNADAIIVESDIVPTASGILTSSDVDNPDNEFTAQTIQGAQGMLEISASGAWTFTANALADNLNVGDTISETFNVTSIDGTPSTIAITITGTNDAATVSSASVNLDETNTALTSSGTLTSTDPDNANNLFTAQTIVGTQGTLVIGANGDWAFTANSAFDNLNVGDTISETFNVSTIDGTSSTIDITINGTNDAATVSSEVVTLTESDAVLTTSGTLTATDPDNPNDTFSAQTIVGTQGTLVIEETGTWTFTANSTFDELNVGDSVGETFNVSTVDGTPSTINVTINGTNDAATVNTASAALSESDSALTTSGTLTSVDIDNADNAFNAQTIIGTRGTLVLDQAGAWTFTANSAFDSLNIGDSVSETFNVSTIDGTSSTINIAINGTNDAATVSSATVVLNETDAALSISGLLTSSDPDNQDNVFTAQTIVGARGTLVIEETGGWTFTANSAFDNLNVGESVSETFNVATVDGTPSTIDITINGTNDAATVSSATVVLDETDVVLTTSGVLTATDPDNSDSTFTAQTIVGTQGTLVIEQTGAWTFTANSAFDSLNVGDSVSETFNVSTIDGTPSTIDISINGTNDAATVSAGTALIVESDRPQTISGVLTATDPDDPDNQFTAETIVGTRGEFTIDSNGAWIFTANSAFNELKAGESVVETFDVTTVNGEPSTVQVTIEGRNEAPLVATTVAPPSLFDSHASDFSGFNFNWRSIDASLVGLQTDNPNGRIEVGRYRVYGLGSRTDYLLELEGNRNDPSNVFKEFETNPGEVYKFTFDHSNRRGAPGINSGINVLQDGTIVETILSPLPGVGFTNYSFDMIATQSTTRFELQALTRDSVGSLIDNMKIELVGFTTDADIPFTIDASVNALDLGVAGNVLEVTLRDIPIGATVTDDNNTFTATAGGQSIDLSSWDLANLTFDHSAAGHHELVVEATLTDASGNVRTTIDTIGFDLLNSDGTPSTTVNANHVLEGSDGGDQISGGIGADELIGGLGDDLLGGGIGVDVFTWEFGDEGTTQSPTVDTLTDFDTNTPTAGGDVLDLRDLLIDEDRSDLDNLDNYLYFENQGSDTVLHISTDGEFNNGFDSSKVEQTIVIENADLLSGFADQQALLQNLINTGKLLVDNG